MKGSLYDDALLEHDTQPHIHAYYFKHWQEYTMSFHWHNATEIMYIIQGTCQVEVRLSDGRTERMTLGRGEFILIDANVPHRLLVEHNCRMLNVEFAFKRDPQSGPSLAMMTGAELSGLATCRRAYWVLSDQEEIYAILKGLVLELDRSRADETSLIRLLFAQLLIRLARLLADADRFPDLQVEHYARHCIEFLHHNYDRNIQVKDVASAVNLHPGYVQRLFRQQTGRTLNGYLTSLRIDKAKMLLARTDIPIIEISDYIGLNSRQYFHALFKKITGMTPMDYRRSMAAESYHYPAASDDS